MMGKIATTIMTQANTHTRIHTPKQTQNEKERKNEGNTQVSNQMICVSFHIRNNVIRVIESTYYKTVLCESTHK